LLKEGASDIGTSADSVLSDTGGSCGLSFTSTTPVATDHGKQAIGTLEVGEKVWAYNPQTHHMELEPIQHLWLNHDSDLVDLTLATTAKGSHGKTIQHDEVIHTNERHPFLTKEKGFVPVSQLVAGMHIRRADGSYGVVARLMVLAGAKWMYNLEVAQDHTYVVGVGQWVVHNCNLQQIANAQAKDLWNGISNHWGRRFSTVAVAFVQDDATGDISRLIGMNTASMNRWGSDVIDQIGSDTLVPGLMRHAEQNILQYAGDNGLTVLAIGASRNVCEGICWHMIASEWGPSVIGTPSKDGWFPSWMWADKFRQGGGP